MEYNVSRASRRMMRDYGKQKKQEELEYYKEAGIAILDPKLADRWCDYVEQSGNSLLDRDNHVSQTLQILSLIKLQLPNETIARIIGKLENGEEILRTDVSKFVNPNIISKIVGSEKTLTL